MATQLVVNGGKTVFQGAEYRVVNTDTQELLFRGDEAGAVVAAQIALDAGIKIAYDLIIRTIIDPTP